MRRPLPGFVRALRGTAGPHAEAARHRLVADDRDPERQERASALYEELRLLDRPELEAMAEAAAGDVSGYGRQALIAVVIDARLSRADSG